MPKLTKRFLDALRPKPDGDLFVWLAHEAVVQRQLPRAVSDSTGEARRYAFACVITVSGQ